MSLAFFNASIFMMGWKMSEAAETEQVKITLKT